jgi:hypothetical protein
MNMDKVKSRIISVGKRSNRFNSETLADDSPTVRTNDFFNH